MKSLREILYRPNLITSSSPPGYRKQEAVVIRPQELSHPQYLVKMEYFLKAFQFLISFSFLSHSRSTLRLGGGGGGRDGVPLKLPSFLFSG